MNLHEHDLWLALADLFFLDTEPSNADFERVAALIKENNLSKESIEKTLIELIAPTAGANLGNLIYPTIGIWDGFDKKSLCEKIEKTKSYRERHPKWFFLISDWWSRRMLKMLKWEQLLNLI